MYKGFRIVKMAILSKLAHKLGITAIKVPAGLVESDKKILKIIEKCKGLNIAKLIFIIKNKVNRVYTI